MLNAIHSTRSHHFTFDNFGQSSVVSFKKLIPALPLAHRLIIYGLFLFCADESDYSIPTHTQNLRNMNVNEGGPIQLKLLCGADLLESFATPGLWKGEDVGYSLLF